MSDMTKCRGCARKLNDYGRCPADDCAEDFFTDRPPQGHSEWGPAAQTKLRATLEDGREDAVRRGVQGYSTEELEAELRKRKMSAIQVQLNRREEIRTELQEIKVRARILKDELEGIKISRKECPDHFPSDEVSGAMMPCSICGEV